MTRLDELLDAKKKSLYKRKMGNRKKVWHKSALEGATIVIGDDE